MHGTTKLPDLDSGFRMMEIHDLYFDFELPWWSEVYENPADHMRKTMAYLHNNFESNELVVRQTQIHRGLKAGWEELMKITKRYLL